ncbi:AcvB/VirJ family lysyl-phosphatidylglycerol hydrolase [Sphingobium aquiterrae]|uniref:AcvB/VirJ family lysyl-phosphatidylglycerol hydrolase n=1 Tax=Sphingobium aquiterrae TaxID=2038656 RepID=UPI003015DEAF
MRTILLALLTAILLFFAWIGYLGGSPFANVPATVAAQAPRTNVVAVLFSGDMGFHVGMGPQIARRLSDEGIAVTGVNSLTYFRTRRTPREATQLIEQAMAHALAGHPGGRVILIGQSFGADMLQVGLAGLDPARRAQVAMVALVVPGATVEYRASPGEVFTFLMHEDDGLPTGRMLGWVPTLCIYGVEEPASLCPLLKGQRNVQLLGMPGGHPLHHDPDAVFAQLRRAIDRALSAAPGAFAG